MPQDTNGATVKQDTYTPDPTQHTLQPRDTGSLDQPDDVEMTRQATVDSALSQGKQANQHAVETNDVGSLGKLNGAEVTSLATGSQDKQAVQVTEQRKDAAEEQTGSPIGKHKHHEETNAMQSEDKDVYSTINGLNKTNDQSESKTCQEQLESNTTQKKQGPTTDQPQDRKEGGNTKDRAMSVSSDSSSSSSDDEDNVVVEGDTIEEEEYKLKMMIEKDDTIEDEFGPRTENEKRPDQVELEPLPTDVKETDPIVRCGKIMSFNKARNSVVVMAVTPDDDTMDIQTIDMNSVLCTEERKLVGRIEDVFGPVVKPFYLVRHMQEDTKLESGQHIYVLQRHSAQINPSILNAVGSDASNVHDEEPNDEELDFSDDEEETIAKQQRKKKKQKPQAPKVNNNRPPTHRSNQMNRPNMRNQNMRNQNMRNQNMRSQNMPPANMHYPNMMYHQQMPNMYPPNMMQPPPNMMQPPPNMMQQPPNMIQPPPNMMQQPPNMMQPPPNMQMYQQMYQQQQTPFYHQYWYQNNNKK